MVNDEREIYKFNGAEEIKRRCKYKNTGNLVVLLYVTNKNSGFFHTMVEGFGNGFLGNINLLFIRFSFK